MRWLLLIILSMGFSDANAAIVRGIITNEENNLAINGATVELLEKRFFTTADPGGFFSLPDLPEGTYHLKITAIGFTPDSLSFIVKPVKIQLLHIRLKAHITILNDVVIANSMDAGSQSYSRILERRSVPLVNIISRQSIEQAADMTMTDAIQRASGISMSADQSGVFTRAIIRGMDAKYSYISVNGIALPSPDDRSRYLDLNLFPANTIQRLEIYKTRTPEMPGDAIAGTMNIVTYETPAQQQFSVQLATHYDQLFFQQPFLSFDSKVVQRQSPYEKYGPGYYAKGSDFTKANLSFRNVHPSPGMLASVSWGRKFLQEKLGVVANAGMQDVKEGSNSFFIVQNNEPQLNNVPGITDFTQRRYATNSNRRNAYVQVAYHLNSRNYFQVSQLYTWKKDAESRSWVDTSLAEGRTGPGTGRIAFSQRSRLHYQSLYHINIQGNHQVNDALLLNWAAVYSNAYGSYPDWAEYGANTGRILGADGNITQTPVLLSPMNRIWMHNSEKEKDLSVKILYTPPKIKQLQLKAGTLLQYRNRNNFYNQYIFNPAYTTSGGQPYGSIYQAVWYDNNGPQNPLGNVHTSGTYLAKENISAFFGELDLHLKKVNIVTGLRNEHTGQSVTSAAPPVDGFGQQIKIDYTDWLPSLHLRYALNEKQDLRLSYYKAISRPALYDITFFNMSYDDYTVAGNPFLKHSTANNFDVQYGLYRPAILNELQVAAFYKQIKNPYEKTLLNANDTLYPLPSGGLPYTPAAKITEQLRNFGAAYNYGLDITVEKKWDHMDVTANYTFTSSHLTQSKKYKQREIPGDASSDIITVTRLQNRPLQGQSQHIANVNVRYQLPRWGYTTQLTGFYTGRRIENVSGWYNMDNWQKGYAAFNFSVEKSLNRHWRFFAKVNNLLNASPLVYMNGPVAAIPEQTEKGKLVIERTYMYRQYLIGAVFKL